MIEQPTVEVTMLMSPELIDQLKAGSGPIRITLREPEISGGYWEFEAHQAIVVDENTSDGFHTFRELYDHRRALTAALFTILVGDGGEAWRSKRHHPDNDRCFTGYFIVGAPLGGGMITYHYPLEFWDDFHAIPEIEHAPKWDGESPAGIVQRLLNFVQGNF